MGYKRHTSVPNWTRGNSVNCRPAHPRQTGPPAPCPLRLHGRLGMPPLPIFGPGLPFTIRLDSAALWADGPIPKTPPLLFIAEDRAIAASVAGMRTFNEMP